MLVIGDADVLVAFADPQHGHHNRVKMICHNLCMRKAYGLFPTIAVCEAVTVLQSKLERPELAAYLVDKVNAGVFKLHPVDQEVVLEAIGRFNPYGGKGNTLFDAIIAVIAIRFKADAVFSFDHCYKEIKLKLVEELFL